MLESKVFRHRLDNEIGIAHTLTVHVRNQSVERIALIGLFLDDLAEQIRCTFNCARNRLRLHVGERHAQTLIGAPGRNVATHRARTDDVDMLDGVFAIGEFLHLLAQEENTNEILRSRRHHQTGERRFLGTQHRGAIAAVFLPKGDQRIRRGVMFFWCRLARLGTHAIAENAAYRPEIHQMTEQALLVRFQAAEDRVLHRAAHVTFLGHCIDKTKRLGLAGVDGFARQHHRHRFKWADEMCEPRRATQTRMQAKHHFGKSEPRIVDGDPRIACERNFQTSAETETVNDSDTRNFQRFQPIDDGVRLVHFGFDLTRIGRTTKLVHISARNEPGCFSRANNKSRRTLGLQRADDLSKLRENVSRQRVGAGVCAIEEKPRYAIFIARQFEILVSADHRSRPKFEHTVLESVHDARIHDRSLTPSRLAWRRRARRRCIRWRFRAWCRAASWR